MARKNIRNKAGQAGASSEPVAINIGKMPWRELRALASRLDVLRRGQKRPAVVRAVRKALKNQ